MNSDAAMRPTIQSEQKVWRVEPLQPNVAGQLRSVWQHRFLLRSFGLDAVLSVYRNTILGIAWMAIRPLTLAVGSAFVVQKVIGISTTPIPLPLFILVGLAAWTLLRRNILDVTKSMLKSRALLQQVCVPPLLLLITALTPGLFQFAVVALLTLALIVYYGPVQGIFYIDVGLHTLLIVPAIFLTLLISAAIGCFTAILNVIARDTQLTLRYVLSFWMLMTPVLYPIQLIPEQHRWILYLNPMTSILELYRQGVFGYGNTQVENLAMAIIMITLLLILGIWFFAKQQNRLFDYL